MYCCLGFDATRAGAPWSASYFALPEPTLAPPPHISQGRRNAVTALVKLFHAQLNEADKSALIERLDSVVQLLPDTMDKISFEMHMALAHCTLEAAQRAAREQRIAAILDPHLVSLDVPEVQRYLQQIKLLAVMVPDAAMDAVLRTRALYTHQKLLNTALGRATFAGPLALLDRASKGLAPIDVSVLYACFFTRQPVDRQACLDLIEQARLNQLNRLMPPLIAAMTARQADFLAADMGDVLIGAMQAWVALVGQPLDSGALDDLVAVEVERFLARRSARCCVMVEATLAAMDRGIAFDPATAASNTGALTAHIRLQSEVELSMTVPRLRKAWTRSPPPVVATPDAPLPDLDPVHAWSVDRLVRWIEGPVTRRRAGPRLDTAAIVTRERQARSDIRARSARPGLTPSNDDDLSEKDVLLAMSDALRATARFFIAEIGDLTRLGLSLKADAALLSPCLQLREPLGRLVLDGGACDTPAQDLLQRTEEAVNALRQGIRGVQGSLSARQHFMRSVNDLLRREPLVRGKRHGGVIGAALATTDWAWAVQQFHGRWLPGFTQLSIDGAMVALPADQALGLYVTGSSLSAHAFDISVHLWRRCAGSTGPAGMQAEHLAPMNTADWFDTYIPCAVLHVPRRAQ